MRCAKLGALFACALFACGQPVENKSGPSAESKTFLYTIQFQNHTAHPETLTETQFKELATRAFRGIAPSDVQVQRGLLSGNLEASEGQWMLRLTARFEVSETAKPVETSLSAVAAARLPVEKAVENGLRDLTAAAGELLRLVRASTARKIEALSSSELDVQVLAAFLLGESKQRKAVPSLCKMLGDPRDAAADAAATALMRAGTPEDVPKILQTVKRGDLRSEVRVIEIIGHIGGNEAKAYLEMTALGHENSEVRGMSQSLLRTLNASPVH